MDKGIMTAFGNERLEVGAYKLMLHGAGSVGTVAVFNPPIGKPNDTEFLYFNQEKLNHSFYYV